MKMTLYLDVDGVILGRNSNGDSVLIPNIEKIFHYCNKYFKCCWLSTHGRHSTEDVLDYLWPYSRDINFSIFKKIEAVRWNTLKTEAIDFSGPFIWIDDHPLDAEIKILKNNRCFKNWLHVDTYQNIMDLTEEKIEALRQVLLQKP